MSKSFIAIFFSSLLFSLAWNNLFPAITLFFAFIPVFYLLENKFVAEIRIFLYSFIIFIAYHLGNVCWLYNSSVIGFLLIIIINSLYFATAVFLVFKLRKIFGNKSVSFIFPVIWLSFEYIHYHWELSWPYMNIGNWLGQVTGYIQWYEFTGVLGGSFWIILINILIYTILKEILNRNLTKSLIFGFVLLGIILIPILISNHLYNSLDEYEGEQTFRIIQPNIDPYTEKYNQKLHKGQIERQISLADFSDSAEIDCYIFPESSFPVFLNEDSVLNDPFMGYLKAKLHGDNNSSIIGGLYSFSITDNDTVFYNTAFFLNRDTILIRHKSKLVIGVEKMPFEDIFIFLKHFNFNFGGLNNSLSTDNQPLNFTKSDYSLSAGTIVCYESIYGEFVSEFVNKNAGLLILITNDAWWGNTPAYQQILMHSKIRTIENRRYLVRAGNTGVSCVINSNGDVVKEIRPLTVNSLTYNVPLSGSLSFYVRHGDYIGKLASFCTILILLLTIYTIKFGKYRRLKM